VCRHSRLNCGLAFLRVATFAHIPQNSMLPRFWSSLLPKTPSSGSISKTPWASKAKPDL